MEEFEAMANAGEIIERLARECERQRIQIEKLEEEKAALQKELEALKAAK